MHFDIILDFDIIVDFVLQPPFYSRDTAEMYDNILFKPLRLRTNVSAAGRTILEGVSITETADYKLVYCTICGRCTKMASGYVWNAIFKKNKLK